MTKPIPQDFKKMLDDLPTGPRIPAMTADQQLVHDIVVATAALNATIAAAHREGIELEFTLIQPQEIQWRSARPLVVLQRARRSTDFLGVQYLQDCPMMGRTT